MDTEQLDLKQFTKRQQETLTCRNIQTSQYPTSLIKTTATSNFCLVLRHPNVNTKATDISM